MHEFAQYSSGMKNAPRLEKTGIFYIRKQGRRSDLVGNPEVFSQRSSNVTIILGTDSAFSICLLYFRRAITLKLRYQVEIFSIS